ncbi:hypothetical protein QQS21_010506 [Conoideocrella luteorostrata]|uniref:MFS general substrate transporter n=1 Tax=Conoideocrella luteorostrata TaxID=1105319 RepID=A0AAJ0CF69_9HYPO|nr:hypothetical protein QQS21_010506 [Conoideocrella luteorostrata]
MSRPGFWNMGTAGILLSGLSDLTGQFLLGYLVDLRGRSHAMNINISSIFLASVFTLFSLFTDKWPVLAAIVAPLLKCFGGGSHASAFLALTLLRSEQDISLRSAYYYGTGAVAVLAQCLASFATPLLAKHSPFLPYALSVVCCTFAYGAVALYKKFDPISASRTEVESPDAAIREPLIPNAEPPSHNENQQSGNLLAVLTSRLDNYTGHTFLSGNNNMTIVIWIFSLMAISKATRPLFTTYIQHRDGLSSQQAQILWLVRSIMSVVVFGFVLPAVVLKLQPNNWTASNVTLYAARISIILMGLGAFLIGTSGSLASITTALVINTLGVATDLSVLAFSADFFSEGTAGRILMLIASCESAGTLVGIGFLYPIYQYSLDNSLLFLAGGVPYYICAAIYAIVAVLIWTLVPISH